jgi:hypothetical protein
MRPHKVLYERDTSRINPCVSDRSRPKKGRRLGRHRYRYTNTLCGGTSLVPSPPPPPLSQASKNENEMHPLVHMYKKNIESNRWNTAQKTKEILKRYSLKNLGLPCGSSPSSQRNYKDWSLTTTREHDVIQSKSHRQHQRPKTPEIYAAKSMRVCATRPQTSIGWRTKKNSANCYKAFHYGWRTKRNSADFATPIRITWSMPVEKKKRTLSDCSINKNQQTEHVNPGGSITSETTMLNESKFEEHNDLRKIVQTTSKNQTEQEESWIVLKRKVPLRHDTVLCTERDAKNLIQSCDPSAVIVAVHVGRNLNSRFAVVKIKEDNKKHSNNDKVKNIVLKHKGSLGRAYGRWDTVTATISKQSESESRFGFYCSKKTRIDEFGNAIVWKKKSRNQEIKKSRNQEIKKSRNQENRLHVAGRN